MKHPTDLAIEQLVCHGHQVRPFAALDTVWFEIDGFLIASLQELEELGEGVYSVDELWELVLLRRRESEIRQ